MNEALALIFDVASEGDLEELLDEDQLCPATKSEEEHDSVVDNDAPPSLTQHRLAVKSSDSLPTDFSTPIRQNTQPDPVVLDSSDITTALEVSANPVSEVSDTPRDTTTNSSVGNVSLCSVACL